MSQNGSYTPLQLNVLSALKSDSGFFINATAQALQGVWNPAGYNQGTVTSNTILSKLTASIPNYYQLTIVVPIPDPPPDPPVPVTNITVQTYRKLLSLGSASCPALGNSLPSTFKPSYPGYGSWQGATLASDSYPPKNYPTSGEYSYVYTDYNQYAYITGWPGKNSWQKTTDTYIAALPPSVSDTVPTSYDEYFSNGFIATLARQAYYELWSGQFNQYNDITSAFSTTDSNKSQTNQEISSLINSQTMSTNFSNINDLTTNDVSGVNLAFRLWGTDLVNSGKVIDLANISRFGTPSVLLITLQKCNAFTPAVGLALQYTGLTSQELAKICDPNYVPTPDQEKKIYDSFKLISGDDLYSLNGGITLQLNCRIPNLRTLADLLDPLYLFPNSYGSLTVPQYRPETLSSKIYYLIYTKGAINPQITPLVQNELSSLIGIIPTDVATACTAFAMSMQQIQNIAQGNIEKFGVAVTKLELTNKDLPLINQATGTPGSVSSANQLLSNTALGSGNSGVYRQCDYFGAASGYPYSDWLKEVTSIINSLPTTALQQTYKNIFNLSVSPTATVNADLNALITTANAQILAIKNSNAGQVSRLNDLWNKIGNQLFIEQRAIPYAIPRTTDITDNVDSNNISSFVKSLETYAQDIGDGEAAKTLEAISNTNNLGGQSVVAAMREARNAQNLNDAGIPPNNDVLNGIDPCAASATVTLSPTGSIQSVTMTNQSNGYSLSSPPQVNIYPFGYGGLLVPVIENDGSISSLIIANAGLGYQYATVTIDSPPQCLPTTIGSDSTIPAYAATATNPQTFPGPGPFTTFSFNPYLPVPSLPSPTSSPTVDQAIVDVILCNCDCWNL
jgi:hypothetical protein